MPSGLINTLTTSLLHGQNQFASGGLLLMVIGGIAAYLKGIPSAIGSFLRKQLTVSINITDDHSAFEWVEWWFQNQEYMGRARNVDAFTPYTSKGIKIGLKPAPGTHWFFHKHRPLFIHFSRSTEKKAYSTRREENYYLWTAGRDQSYLKTILEEMHTAYKLAHTNQPTLKCWSGEWREACSYLPRPLDSVILPSGVKKTLLDDIKKFKESKTWYESMGIPYHRGYLLYGPPGTGKTSLVCGLSAYLNSTVYVLKLSEMTDKSLMEAISDTSDNSMIVLEDIDCAVVKSREPIIVKEKNQGSAYPEAKPKDETPQMLTLSGLLNALDGMQTPQGVQFFMTTNHADTLDTALLRPGRTDMRIHLGPATDWQKVQLYMRFFPEDTGVEALNFVMNTKASSMADFQEALMHKRSVGDTAAFSASAGSD